MFSSKSFKKNQQQMQQNRMQKQKQQLKKEAAPVETMEEQIAKIAQGNKEARLKGREEGIQYGKDVLARKPEGLTPAERNALQFEANRQIKRSHQAASRRLLGDQSRRGIVGKGGVAYAQERDLQRLADEARSQSRRDLDLLNERRALQNLGALFSVEQGEAALSQLDRQMAIDQLMLEEERKRQRENEKGFSRQWNRL